MKYEHYKNLIETIQPQLDRIKNENHHKIEAIEKEAQEKIQLIEGCQNEEIAEIVGETFGIKIGQRYQTLSSKQFVITGLSKTKVFYRKLRKSDHQPKQNRTSDSEKRIIYFLEDREKGLVTLMRN